MNAKLKRAYFFVIASSLLFAGMAHADEPGMRCNDEPPPAHAQLTSGDKTTASHLELMRTISSSGFIDLDLCAGELTVVGGGDNTFRMTVDLENPLPKLRAGDYLHTLDAGPDGLSLKLGLPKDTRPHVTISLPTRSREVHVNLVRGSLSFDAGTVGGDRSINVVRGNVEIVGDERSYESLEVNVVTGRIHDRGGSSGLVLANKSYSGKGSGSLSVNVVSGNVDIKPID
jgi:hypothetical protein